MNRVSLAQLPTDLHPLKRLSELLGGPQIWIKRDDNTGLAMGGNKARKLEYLMADALEAGADTVITTGAFQSNHARMTVAAANSLGLKCHLVLRGANYRRQGNALLDEIMEANIHRLTPGQEREPYMMKLAEDLRSEGANPYIIGVGGSNHIGSFGYVKAVEELCDQIDRDFFRDIYVAVGSGGTYAGLAIGCKEYGLAADLWGIAVDDDDFTPIVLEIAEHSTREFGLPRLDEKDIHLTLDYIGEGYGKPSPEGIQAIKILGAKEGILLDPVYSGKAMAGLIDRVRQGVYSKEDNILFWHTGGAPALFASEEFFCK